MIPFTAAMLGESLGSNLAVKVAGFLQERCVLRTTIVGTLVATSNILSIAEL